MRKPIIVAHRGLHHEHAENSLKALHAAWLAGITWCEIDIRGSAENEPFLLHDETLERTTAAKGRVDQVSSETLRRLGVASLSELIETMPPQAKLLVEIKPRVHRAAVEKTLALCDAARCIVQSFDAELLRHAASIRRDLKLYLLVDDAKQISGGPWDAINADFRTLDAAAVKQIRNLGFRVGAWTVNETVDIERMLALNVDMLITDEPLSASDICNKIG